MREGLYQYGDEELALRVFNEEWLYLRRHSPEFWRMLRETYQFTNAQGRELREALAADSEEV